MIIFRFLVWEIPPPPNSHPKDPRGLKSRTVSQISYTRFSVPRSCDRVSGSTEVHTSTCRPETYGYETNDRNLGGGGLSVRLVRHAICPRRTFYTDPQSPFWLTCTIKSVSIKHAQIFNNNNNKISTITPRRGCRGIKRTISHRSDYRRESTAAAAVTRTCRLRFGLTRGVLSFNKLYTPQGSKNEEKKLKRFAKGSKQQQKQYLLLLTIIIIWYVPDRRR